jgi:hypothetical protein
MQTKVTHQSANTNYKKATGLLPTTQSYATKLMQICGITTAVFSSRESSLGT